MRKRPEPRPRASASDPDFTDEELAELRAGVLPKGAALVSIRREALEVARTCASAETIAAIEASLLEAELANARTGGRQPRHAAVVVLSQTLPNGREQIIFPFAAEILSPSPAGEGRSSSPGSAGASPARVREAPRRGRAAARGGRGGALSPCGWALVLSFQNVMSRRRVPR